MTIFYPDLSSYNAGYVVPTGTVAVVAKATEGVYYVDSEFQNFKAQAEKLGIPFSGYHFLKSESSPEAQAQYYYNTAGKTPCMIDAETEGGSRPGVDWCQRFIAALEALGGRVWCVYYPSWYLSLTGGSLASLGVPIVASDYRSYSDTNWPVPYGDITPTLWQYTSTPIDMNAFKGTVADLAALMNGTEMDLNTLITFSPVVDQQMPDLTAEGFGGSAPLGTVLGWMAARVAHLVNQVTDLTNKVNALQGGTVNPVAVADAELAEIKAKL